jgi:N utilization substance protein B
MAIIYRCWEGKPMSRKLARESAMKLLFELNYKMDEYEEVLDTFFEENELTPNDKEYISSIVCGTINKINDIDKTIGSFSKGWKIGRLAKVDLAVIRLAVYEIRYTDTPVGVVINEAVELPKKYGSEKSGTFINGILASISKEGQA